MIRWKDERWKMKRIRMAIWIGYESNSDSRANTCHLSTVIFSSFHFPVSLNLIRPHTTLGQPDLRAVAYCSHKPMKGRTMVEPNRKREPFKFAMKPWWSQQKLVGSTTNMHEGSVAYTNFARRTFLQRLSLSVPVSLKWSAWRPQGPRLTLVSIRATRSGAARRHQSAETTAVPSHRHVSIL